MGGKGRVSIRLGALLLLLALPSCEKPQLKSGDPGDPGEEKIVAEEPADDFREKRKSVIGQRFETLTLGTRQFADAEVRGITDAEIVIAHADGVDQVPWDEVSDTVREKWGYNPASTSLITKITGILPKKEEPPAPKEKPPEKPPEPVQPEKPEIDRLQLAREIDRQQKMLESQLVGIRNIESDLARHSQRLAELRNKLYALRAQQSRTRSGGIVVERVNGKSKQVDRGREAAEVESEMKVEEQFVAQFTKSLQAAQEKYQSMNTALGQLRSQY